MRSSDWNLLRLEGDLVRDGAECIFTQGSITCDGSELISVEDSSTIVIKSTNYYQISISGFLTKVTKNQKPEKRTNYDKKNALKSYTRKRFRKCAKVPKSFFEYIMCASIL